jgi:PatG C-terminal
LLRLLDRQPEWATAVVWVLKAAAGVRYALLPGGPWADMTYAELRRCLEEQLEGTVQRVGIPGLPREALRLSGGKELPVLEPELRGIWPWRMAAAAEQAKRDLFERLAEELRGPGVTADERARNLAACHLWSSGELWRRLVWEDLALAAISSERSPIRRPGSDCRDVVLSFFNPSQRLEQGQWEVRLTVDVGDVVPVVVGEPRRWWVSHGPQP